MYTDPEGLTSATASGTDFGNLPSAKDIARAAGTVAKRTPVVAVTGAVIGIAEACRPAIKAAGHKAAEGILWAQGNANEEKAEEGDDKNEEVDPRNLIPSESPTKSGVKKKRKEMEEGKEQEPIEVVEIGGKLYVKDGHHRQDAAKKLGRKVKIKKVQVSEAEKGEILQGAAEVAQKKEGM